METREPREPREQVVGLDLRTVMERIQGAAQNDITNDKILTEWFTLIEHIGKEYGKAAAYENLAQFRNHTDFALRCGTNAKKIESMHDLLRKSYIYDGQDNFDSYCIALEWKRDAKQKFYLPRRQVLSTLTQDFQDLSEDKIKFLGVSLPPRTGKSTLSIFFLSWIMGKGPNEANAMGGYSDTLSKSFYEEVLSIVGDPHTYAFNDIFPNTRIMRTSAKYNRIDLVEKRRFPTLTCRSIEGSWTGDVEVSERGLLYLDDLVKDFEEAINPSRLEMKYDTYLNIAKDRKKDGARELMIGTRWNVFDPLGRIEEQYEGNPQYRFRRIPALNDKNESNFQYQNGVGFSTAYYLDMKESIADTEWQAKYQQNPYVREGLVFPPSSLKTYNGVTPGDISTPPKAPDRIVAVVDVAWGGGDSLSMPIAHIYDNEVYIVDWLFSTAKKEITRPLVCGMIRKHGIQVLRFEANNGGDEYADKVAELMRAEGWHMSVSSKKAPGNATKLSRIIQWSDDISNFYFLQDNLRSEMYRKAMKELGLFVQLGKNKHDDAPDSLAMLADEVFNGVARKIRVLSRPF